MTVKEALHCRFSCRMFSDQEIRPEMLMDIFEDAFQAPFCENSQPWEVYVAGLEAMKELRMEYENFRKAKIPSDLSNRFNGRFDYTMQKRNLFYAPVMIFLCIDQELPDWSLFDIGMFAQSLMLSATKHGLATMASAVSVSYPEAVHRVLHIPENKKIVIGIGIGYPQESASINRFRPERKGTDEIHYIP